MMGDDNLGADWGCSRFFMCKMFAKGFVAIMLVS